jgi:general secretion pathway protein G
MRLRLPRKSGRKVIKLLPMPHSCPPSRPFRCFGVIRAGFTLVELLTVIAVIGILMAILVPTVGFVQVKARSIKSTANLSSIGKAILSYTQENHGLLPAPIFGTSTAPAGVPGSSNPRGGTWLKELIGPKYLGGGYETNPGTTTIEVTDWPPVLTDPQYISLHAVVSEPDIRGYGMNVALYRADKSNKKASETFPSQRQKLESLPNPGKNIIIGTSNDVIMEPGPDGHFDKDGPNYVNGDPERYGNQGIFLFLDGSVEALSGDQVANLFEPQP